MTFKDSAGGSSAGILVPGEQLRGGNDEKREGKAMNAVDILKHCREAKGEIAGLREQIERKREILTALPTLKTDDIGGGHGTPERDKTGRILADIDMLEREIQAREDEWSAESIAAVTFLDRLPLIESKILYQYYIKRRGTEEIANKENYTSGYVRKAKRTAEKKLEFVLFDEIAYLFPDWYREGKQST